MFGYFTDKRGLVMDIAFYKDREWKVMKLITLRLDKNEPWSLQKTESVM
jgi:hypothetical protein